MSTRQPQTKPQTQIDQEEEGEEADGWVAHPTMVHVPDAIRMVLRVAAQQYRTSHSALERIETVSLSSSSSSSSTMRALLLGRRLAHNVIMPEPGYPPYPVSIMDGYCIYKQQQAVPVPSAATPAETSSSPMSGNQTTTTNRATGSTANLLQQQQQQQPAITHVLVDHVFAGDNPDKNNKTGDGPYSSDQDLPTAIYITTGAQIPDGYNQVVPVEECTRIVARTRRVEGGSDENNDNNDNNEDNDEDDPKTSPKKTPPLGYLSIPDRYFLSSSSSLSMPNPSPPSWIRAVGSDLAPQSIVLPQHFVLDSIALGLLQQTGVSTVKVYQPVRVGILSTGNELRADDSPSNNNNSMMIPDVNRLVLQSLLEDAWGNCCTVMDLGLFRDTEPDMNRLVTCLQQAKEECDMILTTGAISQGVTDRWRRILFHDPRLDPMDDKNNYEEEEDAHQQGGQQRPRRRRRRRRQVHFERLWMKPGKPTCFVTLPRQGRRGGDCLIFALPGNPVSAVVCTQLLVYPCVQLLQQGVGGTVAAMEDDVVVPNKQNPDTITSQTDDDWLWKDDDDDETLNRMVSLAQVHTEVTAQLSQTLKLDPDRPEYHRVTLQLQKTISMSATTAASYVWMATSTGPQRSSRLASLRDAHGLAVLPQATPDKTHLMAGEECTILLLGNQQQRSHRNTIPPMIATAEEGSSTTNPICTTVATSRHINPLAPSFASSPQPSPWRLRLAVIQITGSGVDSDTKTASAATRLFSTAQSALTDDDDRTSLASTVEIVHATSHSVTATHPRSVRQDLDAILAHAVQSMKERAIPNALGAGISCDLLLLVSSVDTIPNAFVWHTHMAHELVSLRTTLGGDNDQTTTFTTSGSDKTKYSKTRTTIQMDKLAPALAQQVLQGGAASNSLAALWDVVVGVLTATTVMDSASSDARPSLHDDAKASSSSHPYLPTAFSGIGHPTTPTTTMSPSSSFLVVLLSDQGLETALCYARDPLRQAAAMTR